MSQTNHFRNLAVAAVATASFLVGCGEQSPQPTPAPSTSEAASTAPSAEASPAATTESSAPGATASAAATPGTESTLVPEEITPAAVEYFDTFCTGMNKWTETVTGVHEAPADTPAAMQNSVAEAYAAMGDVLTETSGKLDGLSHDLGFEGSEEWAKENVATMKAVGEVYTDGSEKVRAAKADSKEAVQALIGPIEDAAAKKNTGGLFGVEKLEEGVLAGIQTTIPSCTQ